MRRSLWLSTVTALIVLAAVFAGSAVAKTGKVHAVGGTMTVDLANDTDYTDPALDYLSTGWELEYATCLKLVNYPDKPGRAGTVLIPEAATALPRISADGKTYTFTIRRGLEFNTGEAVTAATFANLINRDLNPKLVSPSVAFLGDVVGADAVVRYLGALA